MITKNLGMLLLAIYLSLVGIIALTGFLIPGILTGILALVAGIFDLLFSFLDHARAFQAGPGPNA